MRSIDPPPPPPPPQGLTHILHGCFTGAGAIVQLHLCQRSKPEVPEVSIVL